jgi:glycine cleavage system aminomethyltransferase T
VTEPAVELTVDGRALPAAAGDTVALAIVRAGEHPAHGGTLCLAGDCGNCVAEVDGVAWIRTCQVPARDGTVVQRHPAAGAPVARTDHSAPAARAVHEHAAVVVVGAGASGLEAARRAEPGALVLDATAGQEVVTIDAGPTLVVRRVDGAGAVELVHLHAHEVVLATGAAELQPVCPGNRLRGLFTARAARAVHDAGIELPDAVAVGEPPDGVPCRPVAGRLLSVEGERGTVTAVVVDDGGVERTYPCRTVIVGLGSAPRDVLARMAVGVPVSVVGPAAAEHALPPAPTAGVVCACAGTTVEELEAVWSRGFTELELVKRASLCGTGTCQGAACLPHLRAFVADRSQRAAEPFTARPAARQLTLGEAASSYHLDPTRRTALHEEHLSLGAHMDRFGGWWRPWTYGDLRVEYDAVRHSVSVGDVSTLGKLVVSGPDVVEALERLYPCHVHDIKPGRSRYALVLNERGHLIDDGMICRDGDTRFTLTFTSGGASAAEMWVRDWIETWQLRVHVLDRTMSLGAINVTGPRAADLLGRLGLTDPPRFLQHDHRTVAGVDCHVMRLSFTGEASFELHHPLDGSVPLWRALLEAGDDLGVHPHGLQTLFGLRLEKGHIIVGQDTELDSSPRRVSMDWAVKMDKLDFLGRRALERTAPLPDDRRLHGFTMPGPAPVEGSVIRLAGGGDGDGSGTAVGQVTSSFDSPTLGHAVLLGWLRRRPFPTEVEIDGRRAVVAATPFFDPEGARARA